MSSEYTLSLPPRTVDDAEPRAKATLLSVQASLKFVPNMYRAMANAPGLLETYLRGYAVLREESGFTPAEQEVVFLTISRDNGCEYCVAAHSFVADTMSKVPPAVTDAIRDGRPIPDSKLSALSTFTVLMLATRGRPSREAVETFLAAGYAERHILEIVLAISVKTLSNYTNHLFHTPIDSVFARRAWAA